ncbi:MAG TPA: M23 family metallopeptidase [Pyrinomonadaceae bacterium]
MPFLAVLWLWKRREESRLDWLLALSVAGALVLACFIATPWAMTSDYLRFLLPVFFLLAIYFSFRKLKAASSSEFSNRRLRTVLKLAMLLLLLPLDVVAISSYFYGVAPVELRFPLQRGVYYVIQGGNSRLTSPFHKGGSDIREAYALDIVKLNWSGNRATGVYPGSLNSYAIYNEMVYSPCDGEVIEMVDWILDNAIGDEGHMPSNRIVIRCKGVRITLAHMERGSFLVQTGQMVREGQPLARVGNAGHTSEPHLHIDVVRDIVNTLEPVPVSFDGRILSLNSIVWK